MTSAQRVIHIKFSLLFCCVFSTPISVSCFFFLFAIFLALILFRSIWERPSQSLECLKMTALWVVGSGNGLLIHVFWARWPHTVCVWSIFRHSDNSPSRRSAGVISGLWLDCFWEADHFYKNRKKTMNETISDAKTLTRDQSAVQAQGLWWSWSNDELWNTESWEDK